jgi:hypothetical protein
MPEELKIVVPGTPMGKPRMTRSDKWKKRDCVVRSRAYADLIRSVSGPLPDPEQIADLSWTAYFARPKAGHRRKRSRQLGHDIAKNRTVTTLISRFSTACLMTIPRWLMGLCASGGTGRHASKSPFNWSQTMTDQCQQGSDGKAVIPPREIIPDAERSAFGLGWEHRRRQKPISSNPFPRASLKWAWFNDGWFSLREKDLKRQLQQREVQGA